MLHLFNSGSIFYPYYLVTAVFIAVGWLVAQGLSARSALRTLAAPSVWITRSTLVDAAFCMAYLLILRRFIQGAEDWTFVHALHPPWFHSATSATAAAPPTTNLVLSLSNAPLEALLATLTPMLAIDFASYTVHRALHRGPLWRIHRLHHSAQQLTPLTTYRQHPLEPILLYSARGGAAGLALATLYHFFPHCTPGLTLSGLGAGFFLYMFTANLHHSPVPVRYPSWLRPILMSPHLHHIHHSAHPDHRDRNFGVIFAFWDALFATQLDIEVEPGQLRFGLGQNPNAKSAGENAVVLPAAVSGS